MTVCILFLVRKHLKWMERRLVDLEVCVQWVFSDYYFFINKNAYFVFSFEFISLQLMQNLLKSVSLGFVFFFFKFHFYYFIFR